MSQDQVFWEKGQGRVSNKILAKGSFFERFLYDFAVGGGKVNYLDMSNSEEDFRVEK